MRNAFFACVFAIAFGLMFGAPFTAFAADSESDFTAATIDAESSVITVTSASDLKVALRQASSDATESNPITIRFAQSDSTFEFTKEADLNADNVTIDLNGQTITSSTEYVFAIEASNVTVTNGTLQGAGIRINTDDSKGAVSNLRITEAPSYGIYVCASGTIGNIVGNTISKPGAVGINVQSGTVTGNIDKNKITSCKGTNQSNGSINLTNGAKVSGKISNNTISNGKNAGIFLWSNSSCGNIEYNTITNCAGHAIRLIGSSGASSNNGCSAGNIAHNTITKCKGHGISIYHGSHVGKITYNTLDTIGGMNSGSLGDYGITVNAACPYKTYAKEITHNTLKNVTYASIVVYSGGEGTKSKGKWYNNGYLAGDIAYNTVTNSGTYKKRVKNWDKTDMAVQGAIYVDSRGLVKGSIHHNKVNTSYGDGINILCFSTVKKGIHDNTVNNATYAGIAVMNHATVVGGIKKNTVKSPSVFGIFINSSSSAKTIKSNKVTVKGAVGIRVKEPSSNVSIISNTIKVNGKTKCWPIAVDGGKKKITAKSNKMSGAVAGKGVAIRSKKTVIKNNTVTK